jgi:hypothetical protein
MIWLGVLTGLLVLALLVAVVAICCTVAVSRLAELAVRANIAFVRASAGLPPESGEDEA